MKFIAAVLAAWLFAGAGPAFGADAQSAAPPGDPERGRTAYMHHLCYTCHGTVGQGGERGAGPRLAPNLWPYPAFAQQTRKPRLVMIPYSEKTLPEQDLVDMHAYLRTIKPAPDAKDVPLLRDF